MKYIILLFFTLLGLVWPGRADAAPCQTYDPKTRTTINVCFGDDNDAYDRLMIKRARNAPVIIDNEEPCLVKMEAAMRAMEPWIGNKTNNATTRMHWPSEALKMQAYINAVEQWIDVKASCWKGQP